MWKEPLLVLCGFRPFACVALCMLKHTAPLKPHRLTLELRHSKCRRLGIPLNTWSVYPNMCFPGEKMCSACSRSVSVYSKSVASIYRLTCGHLLCRSCLQRDSQPLNSVTTSAPNHILCPACRSTTPRSDVIRVHHWRKRHRAELRLASLWGNEDCSQGKGGIEM